MKLMPEISLLEPYVLNEVVQKLPAAESMVLLNRFPREQSDSTSFRWDVTTGTRMVATPNAPNSEAHIVPTGGFTSQSAAMIYLREKKVFQATTLRWLRAPGTNTRERAETAVARELTDLNARLDRFAELALWGALRGRLILDYPGVQADIDYKMPASHKVTPAISWDAATPAQIIADIEAWRNLINTDGNGVRANEVFTTRDVVTVIQERFADSGNTGGGFLSDRMRDQYYTTGTIPGFMGLDFNLVDQSYQQANGSSTNYVPRWSLFMGNYTDGNPVTLVEGPSADDDAPQDFVGKFTKTESLFDPSGRQALMEWSILPVVYRPEQLIFAEAVVF